MRRWRNRNQCSHPPYDAGEDGLLSLCNGFARSTILTLLPLSNFASLCGYYLRLVPVGRCLPAYPLLCTALAASLYLSTAAVQNKPKKRGKCHATSDARPLGPPVQRMKATLSYTSSRLKTTPREQFRRHSQSCSTTHSAIPQSRPSRSQRTTAADPPVSCVVVCCYDDAMCF